MDDAMEVFFSAWGDTDPKSRREKLEWALSPEFSYVDPNSPGHLKDFDALDAYVAMFGQMMPGASARPSAFTVSFAAPSVPPTASWPTLKGPGICA